MLHQFYYTISYDLNLGKTLYRISFSHAILRQHYYYRIGSLVKMACLDGFFFFILHYNHHSSEKIEMKRKKCEIIAQVQIKLQKGESRSGNTFTFLKAWTKVYS